MSGQKRPASSWSCAGRTSGQPSRIRAPTPASFFFTRAIYSGGGGYRRQPWATDFPKADRQFLTIIDRLVDLDAYERENAVRLDNPEIRKFPFLYALEVGYMYMTAPEVQGLRDYLLAGGFLMIGRFLGQLGVGELRDGDQAGATRVSNC